MQIDKWLNSPWFVRILALFLALMLWTAVNMDTRTNSNSSTGTGLLPKVNDETEVLSNVPLNLYYNQDKFVVSNFPQTVNIYIKGSDSAITAAKAQMGYEVYVDLENLSVGTHDVQVKYRGLSDKLNVRIDPAFVNITIKEKVERNISIHIQKLDEEKVPKGYVSGEPIVVPNNVIVRGSLDDVKKVSFVEGYIDIGGATDTIEKDIPLNAYDLNGEKLQVEIVPAVVEVKVPIMPPNKKVPYKINRKGTLPKGLSIQSFEVTPTEITVYGQKDKIESIEMIDNIDVDLSNLDKDQTFEVKVPVPNGAIKVSPETLTVKVDIEPEASKVLTKIPFKITGLPNAEKFSLITPEDGLVNLTIFGAKRVLEKIEPSDFDVRLNVANLSQGENEVTIDVVSGPQDIRWEINPSKALVEMVNE